MQWTAQQLDIRAKAYNRIYFNNEIKKPIYVFWSKTLFNSHSNKNGYCRSLSDRHLIVLNITHKNASDEVMRSLLVHEMIHAWQNEYDPHRNDEWAKYRGHGPSFQQKCAELNAKFKFRYPLARYASDRHMKSIQKTNKDVFYVYKMTTSPKLPGVVYPLGVFVKFLYSTEANALLRKGLKIKGYNNARFTDKTAYSILDNQYVAQTDVLVPYSRLQKCKSADTFIDFIRDEFGLYKMASDNDFNFEDGDDVELS